MMDDVIRAELVRLKKKNRALELLLEEVVETIDNYVDVVDGPPGYEHEQKPNWAMSLTTEIKELLEKDWV